MTRDEAKIILQSCLAADAEPADERMEAALAMVQEDPELAAWFENEMSFDSTVREKLSQVAPPPGLKDRILASTPASSDTLVPFPAHARSWWQNPKFISLAACIILIFTFGSMILDPQSAQADPDIPDFYRDIATASTNRPTLEAQSDKLDELCAFLDSRGAPYPGSLPEKIDPLVEVGATSFAWENTNVGLICMKDDHDFQLYVVNLAVFGDDDVPPSQAEVHQHGQVSLLAWSESGKLFVLTVVGSPGLLQELL